MPEGFLIRSANACDAAAIAAIYNYYVLNTIVTFEEEAVSPEHGGHPKIVMARKL